jgi:hypothetical protein
MKIAEPQLRLLVGNRGHPGHPEFLPERKPGIVRFGSRRLPEVHDSAGLMASWVDDNLAGRTVEQHAL